MIRKLGHVFTLRCYKPSCPSQAAVGLSAQAVTDSARIMGYEYLVRPSSGGKKRSFWFCHHCAKLVRGFDTNGKRLPAPPKIKHVHRLGWVRATAPAARSAAARSA